jgi:uncharacterized protein YndB with AHSA1/START domain
MTTMSELELTLTRRIAAPRERVFNAWLSPELMAKFMQPLRNPVGDARVRTDAVEGGTFHIDMMTPEREIPHTGTYLEIRPHERLAFTWASPHSLDDSVVTIDFAEAGPGMTDLTLRQMKFRSEGARDGHAEGWGLILGQLDACLS